MQRVMIFVDYWNFVTNINTIHKNEAGDKKDNFKIDWDAGLREFILREVKKIIEDDCSYSGMFVCGSYDPTIDSSNGKVKDGTYNWATQTLPRFKGVNVRFKPRQLQSKRELRCSYCHNVVSQCPVCSSEFSGYIEKGVDTEIVIEMFARANYDIAVLISDDRDFVAAVQTLRLRGIKVIHARPSLSGGIDLDRECFASIELGKNRANFERN